MIVDTCVLVSLLARDQHTAAADRAVRQSGHPALCAFAALELHDVLGRQVRARAIPAEQARALRELFAASVAEGFWRMIEISPSHLLTAGAWLAEPELGFRAADALHVSVAHSLGETFLTADSTLAKAARKVGVKVKLL